MKRSNPEKIEEAKKLFSAGVTIAEIQKKLKEKYGSGINVGVFKNHKESNLEMLKDEIIKELKNNQLKHDDSEKSKVISQLISLFKEITEFIKKNNSINIKNYNMILQKNLDFNLIDKYME